MKLTELHLHELEEHEFQLEMMTKFLRKEVPFHWSVKYDRKGGTILVRVGVELAGWVQYDESLDVYNTSYYLNGVRQFGTNELEFEEVPSQVTVDMEGIKKNHAIPEAEDPGRNAQGHVISAPLIWRAIKHAEEKGLTVWSDIPGGEGDWTIRYGPSDSKTTDLKDMHYFYVRVQDQHGGDNWFEIIPEDDDLLELHPDNQGGFEVRDPTGKFKT
jgi:hypothetical protein